MDILETLLNEKESFKITAYKKGEEEMSIVMDSDDIKTATKRATEEIYSYAISKGYKIKVKRITQREKNGYFKNTVG